MSPGSRCGTSAAIVASVGAPALTIITMRRGRRRLATNSATDAAGTNVPSAAYSAISAVVRAWVRLKTATGYPCRATLRARLLPITARPTTPICAGAVSVTVIGVSSRPCQSALSVGPPPAPPEQVRTGFGAALASEHALLVAVHPDESGCGGEVGEVPHLLADHGVHSVEHAVVHVEPRGLVFLGPGAVREAFQPGDGVGAVLRDDDRFAVLRPGVQLLLQRPLGGREVAGRGVPPVVPIDHEHVAEITDPARAGRGVHHVDESHRAGWVELAGQREQRLEVRARLRRGRLGLVGDAPQHDARPVLVARHELADRLGVHGTGRVVH